MAERTRLQGIVTERDGQLHEQAVRYKVAHEGAEKAIAEIENRLGLAREASQRDAGTIKQFEQQVASLGKEIEAINRQREEIKAEADRVPVLRKLIEETQVEHRLRFDQTPIGMWRCKRDGVVLQVNQALVGLLRYKTTDELMDVDFSTTVFESTDELQWLVDRCVASRATESVETTWRRKDNVGIVVRLMAMATSVDEVDFVAIDITSLRSLEEKLRNSQRMEAVARYASEVAVTCDKLLAQVNQQGQQWLTRIESDAARQQGALLLDDVTRAAGFLRQLSVYGKEQKNAPELVDVKLVLRDLEPVLKRVAGSQVELVMPKMSTSYNLDVEMERFERILVNIAAYGRERMPFGGRLMIEASTVVVDRTFVEKYPNVRPGAHVLLTVREVKGATAPDWSTTVRDQTAGAPGSAQPVQKLGVDLGAMQALVSDCGGHLWIMAEPSGNMELRIHLPRRVLDDRSPAKKSAPGRWIAKLAGARN
jgi:PAS domain-containing protein